MSSADKAAWLEVSLSVSPDQADAVAEVLSRFTQDGVVIEQLLENGSNAAQIHKPGALRIFGYLFVDQTLEEKKIQLEESVWHLSQIQSLPPLSYRIIHDQDWMTSWKKHYRPLKIGKGLTILPSWAKNTFPSRTPIHINPGMAFGTGTHPTTKLCLILLEKYLQPGQTVFDIGCGSGILSIAAVKLGAKHAYAVDTSSAAIASSAQNAELNQVRKYINLAQGSVQEIIDGCFQIRRSPLVIANILAAVILKLFDDGLADLIEPGGRVILSGILAEQINDISAKLDPASFKIEENVMIEDWVGLCVQKIGT